MIIRSRSISSSRWLREHFCDIYVKKAKKMGLRSRAWFKIHAMQKKDKLLYPGMCVIELGASPGGWSQYILKKIGIHGYLVACDIISMPLLQGVDFIQGSIYNPEIVRNILKKIQGKKVQVILSDISPNLSGIAIVDVAKFMYLLKFLLDVFYDILCPGGRFVVKVLQGDGLEECIKNMVLLFSEIKIRKPSASRSRSREVYIVATKHSI
ncbi:MAG: 23S rRNA 2'-O-ribose methyltransferase [Candidatus Westeberhardia cardiocondylae]|nr:23S rRNA 2'-O-ribose methyltransferase [Candidatus Westeberhardia cardiocondylae]